MYKKIRDYQYRILLFLTDDNLFHRPVFSDHASVNRHRQGYPLVLFNPPVIVGVQIGHTGLFIQRILLDVQPWGIYVRTKNVHSFFQRPFPDLEQRQRFAHAVHIDLVSHFQTGIVSDTVFQIPVSLLFCHPDSQGHTLSLCLRSIQAFLIP